MEPSMRVQNPKKFKRLVAGRCRYCDRRFFYRHPGRPRSYCDHKCQQAEFRHSGYLHPKRDENPLKNSINSKASKADPSNRPLVNVRSKRVERDLWRFLIETETPETRIKPAAPDSNPHIREISDDLSIPPFLRRAK
jgi:hypothetical protein